jgi:hypothetical protein
VPLLVAAGWRGFGSRPANLTFICEDQTQLSKFPGRTATVLSTSFSPWPVLTAYRLLKRDFCLVNRDQTYPISRAVADFVAASPTATAYRISVDVLARFVAVLCGEKGSFRKQETKQFRVIIAALRVPAGRFPDWMMPKGLNQFGTRKPKVTELAIHLSSIFGWSQRLPKPFVVETDTHVYPLNALQVSLSGVLRDYPFDEPFRYHYHDENGLFGTVEQSLRGQKFSINQHNAEELRQISVDLQIEFLTSHSDRFLSTFPANQAKLEAEQSNFDSTQQLQTTLFQIGSNEFLHQELGNWFDTEERMCEFTSQVLIVARARKRWTKDLATLVKTLGNHTFIDFLTKRLMSSITENYAQFIFSLYEADLISAELITKVIY